MSEYVKKLMIAAAVVVALVCSCVSCSRLSGVSLTQGRSVNGETDDVFNIKSYKRSSVKVLVEVKFYALNLFEDEPKLIKKPHSSGSGVVVAHKGGKTLVLTAFHVCETGLRAGDSFALNGTRFRVDSVHLSVFDSVGKKTRVRKNLYADRDNDLCVMEVDGDVGEVAEVAVEAPPVDSVVVNVGAPDGLWSAGPIVLEGRYVGLNRKSSCTRLHCIDDAMLFTVPITGGSSGSGVFYDGRLVSVYTMSYWRNTGAGPNTGAVRKFVRESVRVWRPGT